MSSPENNAVICKYCKTTSVAKCGHYRGAQRYWCKVCSRKFKAGDHLFHMKASLDCVSSVLDMYYNGMKVHEIREFLTKCYGIHTSRSLIYQWIDKYSKKLVYDFRNYIPHTGNIWIVFTCIVRLEQNNLCLFDVFDETSKFLITSSLEKKYDSETFSYVLRDATRKADNIPAFILTDNLCYFSENTGNILGCEIYRISEKPVLFKKVIRNLESLNTLFKERNETVRNLRTAKNINRYLEGYATVYNYFKLQRNLNNKTPAETANIEYSIRNWKDYTKISDIKRSRPNLRYSQLRTQA